jgi:lysophospholipase L1-like esterase
MGTRWLRLVSVLVATVWLAGTGAPAEAAGFNPPKHFYLALGDSLAFGAQLGKFFQELATGTYDPASFNTGYVDDFAARMRAVDPGLQVVNLSCPAETTSSYSGLCFFRSLGFALHTSYQGSQESAALAFLRTHPGQVGPITIDIGLNDAQLPCASPTFAIDVACLHNTMPEALVSVAQNLPRILGELHHASPSSEIIVMTYYNAFYAQDPTTDALIAPLNDEIASIAAAQGDRVADAFTPFNRTGDEASTLCNLTFICSAFADEHPTDLGYSVIARQFWTSSGYDRLA